MVGLLREVLEHFDAHVALVLEELESSQVGALFSCFGSVYGQAAVQKGRKDAFHQHLQVVLVSLEPPDIKPQTRLHLVKRVVDERELGVGGEVLVDLLFFEQQGHQKVVFGSQITVDGVSFGAILDCKLTRHNRKGIRFLDSNQFWKFVDDCALHA